jgi:hypothetical protein
MEKSSCELSSKASPLAIGTSFDRITEFSEFHFSMENPPNQNSVNSAKF